MSWRDFNINNKIRLKMRPRGERMFRDHYRSFGGDPDSALTYHPADADGWREFQCWDAMHIFGPGFELSADPPIETAIQWEEP